MRPPRVRLGVVPIVLGESDSQIEKERGRGRERTSPESCRNLKLFLVVVDRNQVEAW